MTTAATKYGRHHAQGADQQQEGQEAQDRGGKTRTTAQGTAQPPVAGVDRYGEDRTPQHGHDEGADDPEAPDHQNEQDANSDQHLYGGPCQCQVGLRDRP
jgi:hypothetical protein